jgi:hypothetical protein
MSDPPESRDQVIAYAGALGYVISAAQLARWHRAGLLPRPCQRPLGRGRGTQTIYPFGTSVQVVALCQIKEEEHRLDRVAFRLWWEGFAVEPEVIRSQLAVTMGPLEDEIRKASGSKSRSVLDGTMRRSLGRRRLEALIAEVGEAATDSNLPPALISWEPIMSSPPSLDNIANLIAKAMAARLAGAPIASLIAQASDDDLILARDRSRSLLALLRNAAAPMAWLYGRSGSVFKMMDRLVDSLKPSDYSGIVAVMLTFAPMVRPEVLAAIDAGTDPPLAHELRQILVIREQVEGAAKVLTPMAIRALLRDKEAAQRYRPWIDQFVADKREEIEAALAAAQALREPAADRADSSAR